MGVHQLNIIGIQLEIVKQELLPSESPQRLLSTPFRSGVSWWQGGTILIHMCIRLNGVVLRQLHPIVPKYLAKGKLFFQCIAPAW